MSRYLNTDEIHQGLLSLLEVFDELCKENDLPYFLAGGTLLGAIRHEGFIPWDDDADVMMLREDYDKLLKLGNQLPNNLELKSIETDCDWEYPFAKINDKTTIVDDEYRLAQHGLFLDIFPIDKLPEKKWKQNIIVRKIKFMDVLRGSSSKKKFKPDERFLFLKKIISRYAQKRGASFFSRKIDRYVRKLNSINQKSKVNGVILVPNYGTREFVPVELYNAQEYVKFESITLSVPKGYETYLSSLYGNYMQLPPENERVGGHYRIRRVIDSDEIGNFGGKNK